MRAIATSAFLGVEDGKVYPRLIEEGETIEGDLAETAVLYDQAKQFDGDDSAEQPPKGDDRPNDRPNGSSDVPADVVEIPADWKSLKWQALKALAGKIKTDGVASPDEARSVIEGELARRATQKPAE